METSQKNLRKSYQFEQYMHKNFLLKTKCSTSSGSKLK